MIFISVSYSRTISEYRHNYYKLNPFLFIEHCGFVTFMTPGVWLFVSFLYIVVLEIEFGDLFFETELCHQPNFLLFLFVCFSFFFWFWGSLYMYSPGQPWMCCTNQFALEFFVALADLKLTILLASIPWMERYRDVLTCFLQGWGIELRAPCIADKYSDT